MKPRRLATARLSFPLAIAIAALVAAPAAHAASGTWTQTTAGTYNWSDTTAWSGGTVASGAAFTAAFNPGAGGAIITTLDSARSLAGISRGGPTTNSWTIANAGFALTMDNGVGNANISISANTVAVVTVDTDLVLNSNLVLTANGNSNNQIILGAAAGGHTITGSANITFNNSTQFGAGKIIINDNINTTGAIFNNSSPNTSQGLSIAGMIGSTVTGVTQNGTATLTLTGANTYTAATTITAGALTVNGASGSINGSSSVSVSGGGTLNISDAAGIVDRIKDTATVTLGGSTTSGSGGNFAFNGNGGTGSATETIGGLALDKGAATITLGNTGTGQLQTLAVGTTGFTRANNGTMLVRGDSLQTAATNATRLSINGASGTGLNLVGGGIANNGVSTAGTNKTLSIVPYFIGDTTAAGNGSNFLTYDTSGGLRPLATGEYTTLAAGSTTAATPENVKAFGGTISTASDVTVNSLLFSTATQTLTGSGGKLIVNSGAVAATANTEVIGSGFSRLTLGNGTWNEGIVTPTSGNTLAINTPLDVTGSGGLTKAGAGTLVLSASNLYTGQTTVNQGTLQIGSGTAGDLGSNTASIVLNAGALTFGRTNAGLTLANAISGIGGVTQSGAGTTVLSGTNSYTGKTTIGAGMLQFAKTASLYNSTTASWTAANIVVGGTLALNVGGTGEFTTGNVATLLTNLGGANGASTAGFAASSSIGFDTTNASGGTFTVANTLANSTGTGGGAIGVTKLGTNTLVLTGPNTYTGATTVKGGTLAIAAGYFSTGTTIHVASGATLTSSANNGFSGGTTNQGGAWTIAGTINGSSTVDQIMPASVTLNNGTMGGAAYASYGTFLCFNAPTTITANGSGNTISAGNIGNSNALTFSTPLASDALTISGYIGASSALTGSVTKSGAGTLTLTGANTYTGTTTVNGGTLTMGSAASLSTNSAIAVATGATLNLNSYNALTTTTTWTNSGTINNLNGVGYNSQTMPASVTLNNGTLSGSASSSGYGTYYNGGATTITANGNANTIGGGNIGMGSGLTLNTPLGTDALTISSVVGASSAKGGSVTKSGLGSLTLSGANIYTGLTTVNGGALSIGSSGSLASTSTLSVGASGTANFANAGQTLGAVSNANTATNALNFSNASGTVVLASLTGAGNTRFGSNGTVTGGIATGTVTSVAALTANLSGGTITVGGVATIGTMTSGTANLNGATSAVGTLNGGTVNLGSTTLTVGNGTNSGAITGASGALTVTGALALSGSNTYGGVTLIGAGGDLRVNGTHSGGGTVNIAATGQLGGSGSVMGGINVSGVLAPGNSIESLGGGALSFLTGSTYAYELQTLGLNGDLTYSSATLGIASGSSLTLTDLSTSTALTNGSKLTLISSLGVWDGGLFSYNAGVGLVTLADDSDIILGANTWRFNYNDTSGGGNFTGDSAGATNFVTLTVIPEPSVAMLVAGMGALALRRRRRNP